MMAIIFGGTMGGRYLDKILHLTFPVCTLIAAILSVFLAIYIVIKDFIRFK
jgi:hypothetical protein